MHWCSKSNCVKLQVTCFHCVLLSSLMVHGQCLCSRNISLCISSVFWLKDLCSCACVDYPKHKKQATQYNKATGNESLKGFSEASALPVFEPNQQTLHITFSCCSTDGMLQTRAALNVHLGVLASSAESREGKRTIEDLRVEIVWMNDTRQRGRRSAFGGKLAMNVRSDLKCTWNQEPDLMQNELWGHRGVDPGSFVRCFSTDTVFMKF